nr:transposase domain-containing protein [Clostridium estertheticum]
MTIILNLGLLSEIAVKPVAITRKNSLFSDSPAGAEASATVFSIINTAAANNLDAYKYLEYLFRRMPNSNFASNSSVLDEYLPWSDKVKLECSINTTEPVITKREESCSESA